MLQGMQFQNQFLVNQFVTWHSMTQIILNP